MAKNSIGSLAVQLQADTSQFVGGMARAQQSIDRVSATATKSRAALSALGAATRNPALGKLGALAGGFGGVANAAGLGLVGGGVAGVAASATFLLMGRIADLERQRVEHNEKIAAAAKEAEEAFQAQVAAAAELSRNAGQIITNAMDPGGAKQRDRQADSLEQMNTLAQYRQTLIEARGRAFAESEKQSFNDRISEVDEALTKLRDAFAEAGASGFGSRIRAGIAAAEPRDLWSRFDERLKEGAEASRELARETKAKAEQDAQQREFIQALFNEWKRENQQAFGPIVTSIANVGSQVNQLLLKTN